MNPFTERMPSRARRRWGIVLGLALIVWGAVWLPPFVGEPARAILMQAFSLACHQLPARSVTIEGVPLAVGDRCLGIYSGVVLGLLALLVGARWSAVVERHAGWVLLAALLPMAIDWAGPVLGGWPNVPLSRGFTGALFGGAVGVLLGRIATRDPRRSQPAEASDASVA